MNVLVLVNAVKRAKVCRGSASNNFSQAFLGGSLNEQNHGKPSHA